MSKLVQLLNGRVAVIEGACYPANEWASLPLEDWGGEQFQFLVEHLNLTRPDLIRNYGRSVATAGADAVGTTTFGAHRFIAEEFRASPDSVLQGNQAAIALAREAVAGTRALVLGSVGPSIELTLFKRRPFQDFVANYLEQIRALWATGGDGIHLQGMQDMGNTRAALQARRIVEAELNVEIPTILTCSIEMMGTMRTGEFIEDIRPQVKDERLSAIGVTGWRPLDEIFGSATTPPFQWAFS